MAEYVSIYPTLDQESDEVPEHYCEQCFDESSAIKPVAGYCIDCSFDLCQECYNVHLRPKPFRNHKLVDKSTRPKSQLQPQCRQYQDTSEKCPRHHEEYIQSFCTTHSQLCCKVCLTIDHQTCDIEEISIMARNIKSSGELTEVDEKLSKLKKGFNKHLNKIERNRSINQKNATEAIDEMKEFRDEFEKIMTETEKQVENQVELVKAEDSKKVESVTETCDVVIDQINKMSINLDKLQNEGDNESIFISIKRAENELESLDKTLLKLKTDNAAREFKFEPDLKLKSMLSKSTVLGHFSCQQLTKSDNPATRAVRILQHMAKKPNHLKDIKVSNKNLKYHGLVVLPNQQIVVTDFQNKKVKVINTTQDITVSYIKLSSKPVNITKAQFDELAVTLPYENKIQMLTFTLNKLSLGSKISVNGKCHGIAYNDKDQTFVVSYKSTGKVEIINMSGTVVRTIDAELFHPYDVAMSPDLNGIYVSDVTNNSLTLSTLEGQVKATYNHTQQWLQHATGICVHRSGVVYLVGHHSHTVHQLDPRSGKLKVFMTQEHGLSLPWSVGYCDQEDKIYIGNYGQTHLKVFEMK